MDDGSNQRGDDVGQLRILDSQVVSDSDDTGGASYAHAGVG